MTDLNETTNAEIREELAVGTTDLLCCPFCGGDAEHEVLDRGPFRHVVECMKCGVHAGGSAFENHDYNAKKWNTRSATPSQPFCDDCMDLSALRENAAKWRLVAEQCALAQTKVEAITIYENALSI